MLNFKGAITSSGSVKGISPSSFGTLSNPRQVFEITSDFERKLKTKYNVHEQKEPGKLKQKLESSMLGNSDYGSRLFEALMIYGPDKAELSKLPSLSSNKTFK